MDPTTVPPNAGGDGASVSDRRGTVRCGRAWRCRRSSAQSVVDRLRAAGAVYGRRVSCVREIERVVPSQNPAPIRAREISFDDAFNLPIALCDVRTTYDVDQLFDVTGARLFLFHVYPSQSAAVENAFRFVSTVCFKQPPPADLVDRARGWAVRNMTYGQLHVDRFLDAETSGSGRFCDTLDDTPERTPDVLAEAAQDALRLPDGSSDWIGLGLSIAIEFCPSMLGIFQ